MALRCGIIGITNVGKTTLFNCISPSKAQASEFAFSSNKSNIGIIPVPDERLAILNKLQVTEKLVPATVELIDIPGLTKDSGKGEGIGNKFLSDIRNTDALIHVLRCFDDDNLPHIDGSVDPVRDIETIEMELQIKDIESVDKKILRLEKAAKAGDKEAKYGVEILNDCKNHLESLEPARTFRIIDKDKKFIDDLFLLSAKPVIYVCNVDERSLTAGNKYINDVKDFLKKQNFEVLIIAGKLEAEIAELDDPADRMSFLEESGLKEPGMNKLIKSAYDLLNLRTFFTVGPKEIKAWTIKKGMTAPQAAGVIHSDLERGFIRAEVMKYEDFINFGSEHNCKVKGKFFIEGKSYVVEDGDIIHIRFNV